MKKWLFSFFAAKRRWTGRSVQRRRFRWQITLGTFGAHSRNADIFIPIKNRLQPANSGNEQAGSSQKETPSRQESLPFPIVGIGASADSDITAAKTLEVELRAENAKLKKLIQPGP